MCLPSMDACEMVSYHVSKEITAAERVRVYHSSTSELFYSTEPL